MAEKYVRWHFPLIQWGLYVAPVGRSDTIDYRYKSTDRKELEALYALRGNQDDVLIVRNNLLTDTSIANVALEKEGVWYTPRTPLLKGTKRALLLEQGGTDGMWYSVRCDFLLFTYRFI